MVTVQELIVQYVPMADKLAFKKKRVLPKFIDVEELKSAAYLGLVEAANRFDEKFGVAFSTFAYPRIFGAIHDYLREQGWVKDGKYNSFLSLDSLSSEDGELSYKDAIESKPESKSEECFDLITHNLDDQGKEVIRNYFLDEYSMKEIGEKWDISESRVSQLIKLYKNKIRKDWDENSLFLELAA